MKVSTIDRARRYIAQMAASLQGANGSANIFAAAVVLIRGFHLGHEEALVLLREWNESKAVPLWSERELVAKLNSAAKDGNMAYGHLLKDDDRRQTTGSATKATSKPAAAPSPPRPYTAEELEQKLTTRSQWPPLRDLTGKEQAVVGHGRNCPLAPVEILAQNGLLMADDLRPGCYILADREFRQRRNFSGSPFHHGKKSDNAKGSLAKGFFCAYRQFQNLEPDDLILIVEGAIGLLECVSIQWLSAPYARRWKFLAAHSSSSRFFYEPELLAAIAGHHVRIMPDLNESGKKAARAWRDELRAVGCTVDRSRMPEGFQDLRVILAAGSDGIAAAESILAYPTLSKSGGAN